MSNNFSLEITTVIMGHLAAICGSALVNAAMTP